MMEIRRMLSACKAIPGKTGMYNFGRAEHIRRLTAVIYVRIASVGNIKSLPLPVIQLRHLFDTQTRFRPFLKGRIANKIVG